MKCECGEEAKIFFHCAHVNINAPGGETERYCLKCFLKKYQNLILMAKLGESNKCHHWLKCPRCQENLTEILSMRAKTK